MSSKSICLSCLVIGVLTLAGLPGARLGLAAAQEATSGADVSATLPSTATLPRSYPVVTVLDYCAETAGRKSPSSPKCKKVFTRADFEELVEGLNPKMSKEERRDLARTYGQVMALSQEALRRGLDKNPRTQATLRYARLNLLAHEMSQELYRQGGGSSPEAVEKYYASHKPDFELFTVERIVIPREKQGPMQLSSGQGPGGDNPADETPGFGPSSQKEMKALAEDLHARAIAGEDFAALQEKAFAAAGISSHPKVIMEVGRDGLPADQREILDLSSGQTSSLLSDANAYYIYKLVSKRVPPLDSIREQVEIRMRNQGTAALLGKVQAQAQAKVNEDYFNKYDPPPPDPNAPDVDPD